MQQVRLAVALLVMFFVGGLTSGLTQESDSVRVSRSSRVPRNADRPRPELAGVVQKKSTRQSVADSPDERTQAQEEWIPAVSEAGWHWLIVHHSATTSGSVASIHEEHRRRRDRAGNEWLGIGYHFVIGNGKGMPDGQISPTFRWDQQIHGAHSGHAVLNARGIGICLIGNFEDAAPTGKQLEAVKRLVRVLAVRHQIPEERVIGHSSVKATACPGKNFPMQEVREVVVKTLQG